MPNFGLIGKNIAYSFSKKHFTEKFESEDIAYSYENFDIQDISEFPSILKNNPDLLGLNVTIPYKQSIIPYLDELSDVAKEIGAVNTIKIDSYGKLKGYNTDFYGFEKSILPFLKPNHKKALILGTGGASKAVAFALKNLKIPYVFVSRDRSNSGNMLYEELTEAIVTAHPIIINCSPVGTFPNFNECPDIPYDAVSNDHLLYDLIYNPIQTKFLICGEIQGATISNGFAMLELQAERAWEIWSMG